jgi:hypothetical protein
MSMLDAALAYIARGVPVFPCSARSKQPCLSKKEGGKGYKDATTDETTIRAWWARWPNAMIGMPTGEITGVVVFDVDVKDGVNGYAALLAAGLPQNTAQVATPSGGLHLYYRAPAGTKIKSATGGALEKQFGPGLDTRGEGGFVIVPPSVSADGKTYRWNNDFKIADRLPVPEHLLKFITKGGKQPAKGNGHSGEPLTGSLTEAVKKIAEASSGHRHGELNKQAFLIGQLVAAGRIDEDQARAALIEAGLAAMGATRAGEIESTVADGLTAGKANPVAEKRRKPQADLIGELAAGASLFHVPDGAAFADIMVAGHRETWPVNSKGFRNWLARQFLAEHNTAPNSNAMHDAIRALEARAQFGAPEGRVHIRVAELDGRIYLDLADDQWRAIAISPGGWKVIGDPPVRFRRTRGMLPLPVPQRGGSVAALRTFVNVATEADFVILVAWLLAAMRGQGPYPLMVIEGEQGTAKSSLARILRLLVDPNSAPLRALPREERDLFIAASNSHVIVLDNISTLSGWISDTLCRLSTGGGFAVRKLYSDDDESLFDAERPAILTGIEDMVTRTDLADRSIVVNLEPIKDDRRMTEGDLWAAFEEQQPLILGALCDALAHGLKALPDIRLDRLPRMADFARFAAACEGALWPQGTFMAAYAENRAEAIEVLVDNDVFASAIRTFMASRTIWEGRPSELFEVLSADVPDNVRKSKAWPGAPHIATGRLKRLASFLRQIGIDIEFDRSKKARTVRLARPR